MELSSTATVARREPAPVTTAPSLQLAETVFRTVFDPDLPPARRTVASRREGRPATRAEGRRAEQRRARNSNGLTHLFAERAELQGVSPVADVVVEAVRWSA